MFRLFRSSLCKADEHLRKVDIFKREQYRALHLLRVGLMSHEAARFAHTLLFFSSESWASSTETPSTETLSTETPSFAVACFFFVPPQGQVIKRASNKGQVIK